MSAPPRPSLPAVPRRGPFRKWRGCPDPRRARRWRPEPRPRWSPVAGRRPAWGKSTRRRMRTRRCSGRARVSSRALPSETRAGSFPLQATTQINQVRWIENLAAEGALRILQHWIFLGPKTIERFERFFRPLVREVVLSRFDQGRGVALHRFVLERHRLLQPLVFEHGGVRVIDFLHRGTLAGETSLQLFAAASNLQPIESRELVLRQLETALRGRLGGDRKGIDLEVPAVELGSGLGVGQLGLLVIFQLALGVTDPVARIDRQLHLFGGGAVTFHEALEGLDFRFPVALFLVVEGGAERVLRSILVLGEELRVARERGGGLRVALLGFEKPRGIEERRLAVPGSWIVVDQLLISADRFVKVV